METHSKRICFSDWSKESVVWTLCPKPWDRYLLLVPRRNMGIYPWCLWCLTCNNLLCPALEARLSRTSTRRNSHILGFWSHSRARRFLCADRIPQSCSITCFYPNWDHDRDDTCKS